MNIYSILVLVILFSQNMTVWPGLRELEPPSSIFITKLFAVCQGFSKLDGAYLATYGPPGKYSATQPDLAAGLDL